MKTVFLANVWTELVSVQFLDAMAGAGYPVRGNWLEKKYYSPSPDGCKADIILYSPTFPEGGWQLPEDETIKVPTILWGLFPDYLAGWDWERNTYKYLSRPEILKLLPKMTAIGSPSRYAARVLEKTYGRSWEIWPLGLPIREMEKIRPPAGDRLRVLWNHMWRTDKGFGEALEIISVLANKYPEVDFVIGRKERWSNPEYSPETLKAKYRNFKQTTGKNVFIKEGFPVGTDKKGQLKYWQFLAGCQIGISTSRHEAFGVAMLEQAGLGVACAVPGCEVYPEIYGPECLYQPGPEGAVSKISALIENEQLRREAAEAAAGAAKQFSVENAVSGLLIVLEKI